MQAESACRQAARCGGGIAHADPAFRLRRFSVGAGAESPRLTRSARRAGCRDGPLAEKRIRWAASNLKQAWDARVDEGKTCTADPLDAIREGAVLRVRPKAMTVAVAVAVILAGLFPIMWAH